MYLVNWNREELVLEASLGGRVTVEEMAVFYEDLRETVDDIGSQSFLLVLDYSRTRPFDPVAEIILAELKDFCLENGAEKIVSVVRDTDDKAAVTTASLQRVLEGIEEIVIDEATIDWAPPIMAETILRKAA